MEAAVTKPDSTGECTGGEERFIISEDFPILYEGAEQKVAIPDLSRTGCILIGGSDRNDVERILSALMAPIVEVAEAGRYRIVAVEAGAGRVCRELLGEKNVITDRRKAIAAMREIAREMDARLEQMEEKGVRKADQIGIVHKVLIINEISELAPIKGMAVEEHLMWIVQKCRPANIHCIVTTARPHLRTIREPLRSNFMTRIAARTEHKHESEFLLGHYGAAELRRNGEVIIDLGGRAIKGIV